MNEYLRFNFELNIELNHFLARFNVKMNNQNVSATPNINWKTHSVSAEHLWVHASRLSQAEPWSAVPPSCYDIYNLCIWFWQLCPSCAYILKGGARGARTPQTILNFPQKDCLRTRKVSRLHCLQSYWRSFFPIYEINCQ